MLWNVNKKYNKSIEIENPIIGFVVWPGSRCDVTSNQLHNMDQVSSWKVMWV